MRIEGNSSQICEKSKTTFSKRLCYFFSQCRFPQCRFPKRQFPKWQFPEYPVSPNNLFIKKKLALIFVISVNRSSNREHIPLDLIGGSFKFYHPRYFWKYVFSREWPDTSFFCLIIVRSSILVPKATKDNSCTSSNCIAFRGNGSFGKWISGKGSFEELTFWEMAFGERFSGKSSRIFLNLAYLVHISSWNLLPLVCPSSNLESNWFYLCLW